MFHGLYQADGGQQLGSKVKTEKECCWFFSFTPCPKNQLRCKLQNVVHAWMHFPEPWKGETTDLHIGRRRDDSPRFHLQPPWDPVVEQTQFSSEFLIKSTSPFWAQACLSLLEGKDVRFLSNSFTEQPIEMSICQAIHGKRRGGSISNLRTDTLSDRWHRGWGFITACSKK